MDFWTFLRKVITAISKRGNKNYYYYSSFVVLDVIFNVFNDEKNTLARGLIKTSMYDKFLLYLLNVRKIIKKSFALDYIYYKAF